MRYKIIEPRGIYDDFLCGHHNKQYGGNAATIPPFIGIPYQRGYGIGNIISGLFKSVIPLAKNVFKVAKPILKKTGKQMLKRTVKGGVNVIQKVADGENFKKAIKAEGQKALLDLKDKALSEISQFNANKGLSEISQFNKTNKSRKRKPSNSKKKNYSKRIKKDILD